MRAILLVRGELKSIYVLETDKGEQEVSDYFEAYKDDTERKATVKGFFHYLEIIKDRGTMDLTPEQRKCWKIKGDKFCELRRRDDRISYYEYEGGKVLLISWFQKEGDKANKEYRRAISLRKKFERAQEWKD